MQFFLQGIHPFTGAKAVLTQLLMCGLGSSSAVNPEGVRTLRQPALSCGDRFDLSLHLVCDHFRCCSGCSFGHQSASSFSSARLSLFQPCTGGPKHVLHGAAVVLTPGHAVGLQNWRHSSLGAFGASSSLASTRFEERAPERVGRRNLVRRLR